jgi:hypothetical protein
LNKLNINEKINITIEIKQPKNQPDLENIELTFLNNNIILDKLEYKILNQHEFEKNKKNNIFFIPNKYNDTDKFSSFILNFFNITINNKTNNLDINLISTKGFYYN